MPQVNHLIEEVLDSAFNLINPNLNKISKACCLGVSPVTYSGIIRGKNMSLDKIKDLASRLYPNDKEKKIELENKLIEYCGLNEKRVLINSEYNFYNIFSQLGNDAVLFTEINVFPREHPSYGKYSKLTEIISIGIAKGLNYALFQSIKSRELTKAVEELYETTLDLVCKNSSLNRKAAKKQIVLYQTDRDLQEDQSLIRNSRKFYISSLEKEKLYAWAQPTIGIEDPTIVNLSNSKSHIERFLIRLNPIINYFKIEKKFPSTKEELREAYEKYHIEVIDRKKQRWCLK